MRNTVRLFALAALCAVPSANLLAQSVWFKSGGKEEKWELNDPFAPAGTRNDSRKALWKGDNITLDRSGVEQTRKAATATRIEWPGEPAPLTQARDHIARGEPARALTTVEPVLQHFDCVRKVPGSLWLKAAEVKLDALSGLSDNTSLSSFIALLEENDDGSVPGLADKIKFAKLNRLVRTGAHAAVIADADKLLAEAEEPDMQARLTLVKADALLALRKYEEALNTYLRVPVFFGAEKAAIPPAYLGAAKCLRGLDTPLTHEQRLDLAAEFYLREVVRDYPVSKEAAEARKILPSHEEQPAPAPQPATTEAAPESAPATENAPAAE